MTPDRHLGYDFTHTHAPHTLTRIHAHTHTHTHTQIYIIELGSFVVVSFPNHITAIPHHRVIIKIDGVGHESHYCYSSP